MRNPASSYREPCGRDCQICHFHKALIDACARFNHSDTLSDGGCSVTLSTLAFPYCVSKLWCVTKLKMDTDDAIFRQRVDPPGLKKMCDFVVAFSTGKEARCSAIELKSREPYLEEAAEQLKEGLYVIVNYLVGGPLRPVLRAYLVVGVMSTRLMDIARTKGRLEINGRLVQIELIECLEPLEGSLNRGETVTPGFMEAPRSGN